jgi:hypothetical protein
LIVFVELQKYLKVAGEAAEETLAECDGSSSSNENLSEEEHSQLAKLIMNLHQVQDQDLSMDESALNELNSPRRQAAMFLSDNNTLFRGKLRNKLLQSGVDGQSYAQLAKQGHVAAVINELQDSSSSYNNGIAVYENGQWVASNASGEGNLTGSGQKVNRRRSAELLSLQFPLQDANIVSGYVPKHSTRSRNPAPTDSQYEDDMADEEEGSLIKRRKKTSLQISVAEIPPKIAGRGRGRPPKHSSDVYLPQSLPTPALESPWLLTGRSFIDGGNVSGVLQHYCGCFLIFVCAGYYLGRYSWLFPQRSSLVERYAHLSLIVMSK